MEITIKWLNDKRACAGATEEFEKRFPDGADVRDVIAALKTARSWPWLSWFVEWIEDVELLGELANDADWDARRAVAQNPNTPAAVLTALANDEDWAMRRDVAWNASTPAETLAALARDEDWLVRRGVAWNPSTPPETLTALANDAVWVVRDGVARNPNTPIH